MIQQRSTQGTHIGGFKFSEDVRGKHPIQKEQHVQRSRKKMLASQRASTFQRKENTGKNEKTEMKDREELKKQKYERSEQEMIGP